MPELLSPLFDLRDKGPDLRVAGHKLRQPSGVGQSLFPSSPLGVELDERLNELRVVGLHINRLDQGFDGYLQKRIKPKLRSQMQQYRRKYIESGVLDCHFHSGDEASDLLSELFEHWMSKWSPVKGMSQAKLVRDTYARYLRLAAELGLLRVATLRQGQDLMGGLAFILDPAGRRIHCILSVRNEAVKGGYIGPLLHSEALRFAAEQGFTVYDFCHGDQSYKTRFGGEPLRLSYFSIHRRNLDQSPGVLDPVCIPNAMEKLTRFIRKGDRSKAEAASRQIRNLIRDNLS